MSSRWFLTLRPVRVNIQQQVVIPRKILDVKRRPKIDRRVMTWPPVSAPVNRRPALIDTLVNRNAALPRVLGSDDLRYTLVDYRFRVGLVLIQWWSENIVIRAIVILLIFFLPATASAADKPNFIIIMADDLGYGDIAAGPFEGWIETPALKKMAAQGMCCGAV